jgi:hypothetical protein
MLTIEDLYKQQKMFQNGGEYGMILGRLALAESCRLPNNLDF